MSEEECKYRLIEAASLVERGDFRAGYEQIYILNSDLDLGRIPNSMTEQIRVVTLNLLRELMHFHYA
jgi:hypothetical protein